MTDSEEEHFWTTDEFLDEEYSEIDRWRTASGRKDRPYRIGLALSGGGIRSAIFSLGVIQALARHGILRDVDYVSTVSGGGYIGAALQWWWGGAHGRQPGAGRTPFGVADGDFPYATTDPRQVEPRDGTAPGNGSDQLAVLQHLRHNGNYLIPGAGITVVSGIAIVLRAILLNLLVWIPLAALVFLAMFWVAALACGLGVECTVFEPYAVEVVTRAIEARSFAGAATVMARIGDIASMLNAWTHLFFVALVLGTLILAAFLLASVCFALHTGTSHASPYLNVTPTTRGRGWWPPFAVGVAAVGLAAAFFYDNYSNGTGWLATVLWFAALVLAVFVSSWMLMMATRVPGVGLRYGGRRLFEKLFGFALVLAFALIVVGTLPVVHDAIRGYVAGTGVAAIAGSTAVALWGHWKSLKGDGGGPGMAVLLPVGSALFVYGIALLGYDIAFLIATTSIVGQVVGPEVVRGSHLLPLFGAAVLVAIATGYRSNLNYISPHRFYRDRLMEAFMPDWETVDSRLARQNLVGAVGAAKGADGLFLQDVWAADRSPGPYPIINANVILVNSAKRKWRVWGGDSFALTPLYCGSNATGWRKTDAFMNGELTLPSAMAISGAAANPNSGVGGKGPTRNRLVSILMTLLNFRLGYWVPNPGLDKPWFGRPNHFIPGFVYAMSPMGFAEDSDYVELSDGGHFENLGIYELVRRKARVIFLCDGEADKEISYFSFVTVLRRMKETFGATIDFEPELGPERLVPAKPASPAYPSGAQFAKYGHFVARVTYADGTCGVIIYMKTALVRGLSMEALGYAGAHPDFPDETTADQFFDEEQFEAYRELGYRIATDMIADVAPAAVISRMDGGDDVAAVVDAIWRAQKPAAGAVGAEQDDR